PEVREQTQRLVEVVADVGRRDLVGRDLVAQLGAQLLRQLQVLAFELAAHQFGIIYQEKHAALELQPLRSLADVELQEVGGHERSGTRGEIPCNLGPKRGVLQGDG